MGRIKCLIFDLDGTLFDTRKANCVAYQRAFAYFGIRLTKAGYDSVFGLRFSEMAKKIAPTLFKNELNKVRELKACYYKKCVKSVKLNNSLIELIKHFRKTCKICLVTSASRKNTLFLLDHFKIRKYFDFVMCGENILLPKPHPSCYKECFKKFRISPREALIFEDGEPGIEAARKSGGNYCVVKM